MIRVVFLISYLFISLPAFSQGHFTIKHRKGDVDLVFPLFSRESDSTIPRKINEFLCLSELEVLPQPGKNIFEEITRDDAMGGLYGKKVIMHDTIYTNSSRVLSLEIYNAASGMTSHYWSDFYTFNSQNGDRIDLQDLFTISGWKQFKKLSRKKRIKAFAPIRKQWAFSKEEELYHSYLDDDFDSYYIVDSAVYHNGINLFPKGMAEDLITKFSYSEVAAMLNSYGTAILGQATDSLKYFRSNQRPQLMKGMIGDKYPITFILAKGFISDAKDYAEISAIYAYDKYGKGVALDIGFPKNNQVTMEEFHNDKNTDTCEVSFSFTQTSVKGFWINKSKNKKLSLWAKKED